MIELKQCPKCGRRPLLGYACGEYFIVGQVEGCGVCDTFGEMHASREQEAEAWNRRADNAAHSKIQKLIADTPTVDAVEVVRCRECKHHRDKNEQERQYLVEDILICTSQDATDDCWNAVWPDHYCSYGERKEGADNG